MTRRYALLAAGLIAVAGCGAEKPGTVAGTVTVGGQPLKAGQVTFLSEAGNKDAFSAPVADGRYATGPIPCGACKVYVVAASAGVAGPPAGGRDAVAPPKAAPKKGETVFAKYQSADTSGLAFEVKPGENSYDITIP